MCRRYMPLEEWEWIAISNCRERFDPTMLSLLTGLIRAECLARHSEFARRNGLIAVWLDENNRDDCNRTTPLISTARIEHRLYTLFAE